MEFTLSLSAQQANDIVVAARQIIAADPASEQAEAFHALILGIQAPPASYWTRGVQVSLTTTAGEPVTDLHLAQTVLADLFVPNGVYTEDIEGGENGVWLVSVPAELYAEASEEGGAVATHSGGYVLEIPMP